MHTFRKLALLSTILMSTACATNIHRPEAKADPYENINRKIFTFNDAFYRHVAIPVENGYRAITTKNIRNRIADFIANMDEPISTVNYILQLEPKKASVTVARFVINSTLGLAGLFDVASGWGIEKDTTTTGETLASWCIADGPYVVIPFIGPSTPRNFLGASADFMADPVYWMTSNDLNYSAKISYPYMTVKYISKYESYLDLYTDMTKNSVDPYTTIRSAYMQNQRKYKCRFAPEETTQAYDFDFDDEMED